MKKLLFLAIPSLLLLAVACNKQNSRQASLSPSPTADYLVVKEWGVEIKEPSIMEDLEYTNYPDVGFGPTIAFTTQQLVSLDHSTGGQSCTADQNPIGTLTQAKNFDLFNGYHTPPNVKVGDYYYFFEGPQATCSDNKQVQALESRQASLLSRTILNSLHAFSDSGK